KHAVEGSTSDIDCEIVASKFEPGGCYEITNFRTTKIRGQYNVVPHDNQLIFSGITAFKKLSNVFPPIPQHRFFLQDYNTLYPRLNNVDILTEKIVMNSTGCSLFFVDPNIPEVNAYKSVFANCKEHVKILAPSTKQVNEVEILRTAKKLTIDELAFLDPDLHKNDTFLCKASIKRFDTRNEWWYNACPNCVKQMHKDLTIGQLICQKHPNQTPTPWYKVNLDLVLNQRLVDQQLLPNEFLRLIGQKKKFHLRFGNRRNTLNSSDILIYNVSEDTTMEPITPQPLIQEVTVSSTTILSSTSIAETSGPSYKRKRVHQENSLYREMAFLTLGVQHKFPDFFSSEIAEKSKRKKLCSAHDRRFDSTSVTSSIPRSTSMISTSTGLVCLTSLARTGLASTNNPCLVQVGIEFSGIKSDSC
ncbi:hypothetical protein DVH24_039992, partial [Malus domestica]